MPFPRPDDTSKAFFEAVLPNDPRVQVRPMFGNLAGFVNGNMFAGVFGREVFVRLPEVDRGQLVEEGATVFQPMEGRAMKEYVSFPSAWTEDPDRARGWVLRSLEWAAAMPPKKKAKTKKR